MFRNLLVFLCAAAAASAQSGPTASQISSHLAPAGLKADVSFLASDALQGRGTPSAGLEIAAEYIAAQFRRAGLEPAGDEGYFQNAPFATLTSNLDGFKLTLEVGGKTFTVDKTTVTFQDPAAIDLDRVPVAAVALESPGALDALSPDAVRGKALVASMPQSASFAALRNLSAAADRLQPAIVIILRESAGRNQAPARIRDVSAGAPKRPILVVSDPAFRAAAANLKEATLSAHIAAPTADPAHQHNVVGVLRGSDPQLADTYLLVTAHYDHLGVRGTGPGDHIYNGANDDASGTASVIEIANALSALPAHPKRSIVFIALFGEESGLLGSRYYAAHPIFPLAKTIGDLNLEQFGAHGRGWRLACRSGQCHRLRLFHPHGCAEEGRQRSRNPGSQGRKEQRPVFRAQR